MLTGQGVPPLKGVKQGWGGEKQATFKQNASILEMVGDTYKVTINDQVYSPHRQYGQYSYRQTQTYRQIQIQ